MALPSKNAAEAVRRKHDYIQQQLAKGRSRNAIRKELIQQGMRKVSRAYFNEIVSEFALASEPAAPTTAAQPKAVGELVPKALQVAAAEPSTAPPATPRPPYRSGNYIDDRFDNDL